MKTILGIAMMLVLVGCSATQPSGLSRVGGFLERDLTRAAEIAVAGKDEIASRCFTYLAGVVKDVGVADADAIGIFSALEKARLLRRGTSTEAQDKFRVECGPLAADLMILFAKQGATRGLGGGLF